MRDVAALSGAFSCCKLGPFWTSGRVFDCLEEVVLSPSCPGALGLPDSDYGPEVTSSASDGGRQMLKPERCLRRLLRSPASSVFGFVVDGCNWEVAVVVEHSLSGLAAVVGGAEVEGVCD